MSFVGISLAGSLGNNLAQIGLSYAMIFKESTGYIAPVLLISGLISSLVLGIFTEMFSENSVWFSKMIDKEDFVFADGIDETGSADTQNQITRRKRNAKSVFKQLARDLILILSIVIFSLLVPSGKVLYKIGGFAITQNALFLGLKRALILVLSVEISRLVIPNKIVLKGKLGNFINMIFIYFKKLSEFEFAGKRELTGGKREVGESDVFAATANRLDKSASVPSANKTKNAGQKFTQRLDSYLTNLCF